MAEFQTPTYGAAGVLPEERITDPGRYIADLVREAEAFTADNLHKKPWYQKLYEHPGFLTAVSKSEAEMLDDARQAYVLDRLMERYPSPKDQEALPEYLHRQMSLYSGNADGIRDRLKSDYRMSGLVGALNPESNAGAALEWWDSLSGMATAASQGAADYADRKVSEAYGGKAIPKYPNAYEDFMSSGMTFMRPAYFYNDMIEDPTARSYAKKREDMHRSLDWDRPEYGWWGEVAGDMTGLGSAVRQLKSADESRMPDIEETLVESGVSRPAAALLGLNQSIVVDPFSSVFSARKLARAGKHAEAMKELASEGSVSAPLFANRGIQSLGQ